jgi:aminoglycoside 2''-phosphotransferase
MNIVLDNYRAALAEKFPALAVEKLEYLSEGWDSVAVLVNDRLIFRFPKRASTQENLRIEIQLLPELAKYLPLPIPQFEYIGDPPGQHLPFAFVGYPMLKGASEEEWAKEVWQADWWKPVLGEFLTALHAFPVKWARELGVLNLNESFKVTEKHYSTEPSSWREMLIQFYELTKQTVLPIISPTLQKRLTDRFERFLADERYFQFEPTLIHADFTEDHIIADFEARKINGIIDFGDVAIGDPAMDVWSELLPFYGGEVDETFEERRNFYLQTFGPLNPIIFGRFFDDAELTQMGLEELENEE